VLISGMLVGCQQIESVAPTVTEGMIKVAIFYPAGEDKTFDMEYYANKHMPMAASLLGDDLKAWSIDKGVANGTPDKPLNYLAIGYFYFDSMDSFQSAMEKHSAALRADVPNYTNVIPATQVSEVQKAE
jgi:uncharacterized protein (TIGR02118 family)